MSTKSRLQELTQAEKRLTKVYGIISKLNRGEFADFRADSIAKIKKELTGISYIDGRSSVDYFIEEYSKALKRADSYVSEIETEMYMYLRSLRRRLEEERISPTTNVIEDESEEDDPYFTIIKEKGGVVGGYNYSIGGL